MGAAIWARAQGQCLGRMGTHRKKLAPSTVVPPYQSQVSHTWMITFLGPWCMHGKRDLSSPTRD